MGRAVATRQGMATKRSAHSREPALPASRAQSTGAAGAAELREKCFLPTASTVVGARQLLNLRKSLG